MLLSPSIVTTTFFHGTSVRPLCFHFGSIPDLICFSFTEVLSSQRLVVIVVVKSLWSFESRIELCPSVSERLEELEASSSKSPIFSIFMDDISDADNGDEGWATAAAASNKKELIASSVSLSSLKYVNIHLE